MDATANVQFYLILFFLCLTSSLLLRILLKKPTKPVLHLPPSPPSLPLIGHLHLLSPVLTKCFHNLATKHGPLLYLRFGSRPHLLVSSATFAAEIFKTKDLIFSSKSKSPLDGILFGDSSFAGAPYGDYWRFMKKLCVTEILGARQVERSHCVRREELLRFLNKLVEKAHRNEAVDVGQQLMKLTNNIIGRIVMSTRCSEEDDEAQRCRNLLLGSLALTGKYVIASMLGPFKRLGFWVLKKEKEHIHRECNELMEKILKEHEEKTETDGCERDDKDLMDTVLSVFHDKNADFKISKAQMKSFILDLFIGGTDTSSNTMQWAMAELINHPNAFKKLREEIETVVGKSRLVKESDIQNLHYLQAVMKETMRLYPAIPAMPRECREDCKIGGFDIPKDITVIINAYSIMRDPELWDNPNKFCPERFMQEHNDNQKETKMQSFSFIPFGGGRRMCPGSHLAFATMTVAVASMVQCFDWKVDGDGGKINMEAKAGVVMSMAHPLVFSPAVHFDPFTA